MRYHIAILAVLPLLPSPAFTAEKPPSPPPSRTEDIVDTLHGTKVADPYRWLEDAASAEVKDWTAKQNAFSRAIFDKLPSRAKIHERLNTLLEIGSLGTPVPVKGRLFFTKRDGTQNQPILYVREADGKDRPLVDPNTLAADGTTALDWWFPSRDGELLAYGLSKDGNERSVLHLPRRLGTGKEPRYHDRSLPGLLCGLAAGCERLLLHPLSRRGYGAQGRGNLSSPCLFPSHRRRRPGQDRLRRRPTEGGLAGRHAVARWPLARRYRAEGLGHKVGSLLQRSHQAG